MNEELVLLKFLALSDKFFNFYITHSQIFLSLLYLILHLKEFIFELFNFPEDPFFFVILKDLGVKVWIVAALRVVKIGSNKKTLLGTLPKIIKNSRLILLSLGHNHRL